MNLSTSLASSTASTPAQSVIEVKSVETVDEVHNTISVVVDSENCTKSQHIMVLKAILDDDKTTNSGPDSIKLKTFKEDSGDSPTESTEVISADPIKLDSAKTYNEKSEQTKNDDSIAKIENVEIEHQICGVISASGTTIYLETPIGDEQQHRVHHTQMGNKDISSAKMSETTAKPKCLSNEFLTSTGEPAEYAETLKSPGQNSVKVATHSGITKYMSQNCKNVEDDLERIPQKETTSLCVKEIDVNNSVPKSQVSTADVPSSSYATYPLVSADTQSMDLIERCDFENEQRLTGGILLKTGSLINKNMLNLDEVCNQQNQAQLRKDENPGSCGGRLVYSDSKCDYKNSLATPTSSRAYNSRLIKSPAKINICPTLSYSQSKQKIVSPKISNSNVLFSETSNSVIVEASTSSNFSGSALATSVLYSNSNSNDSMTSDRIYANATSSKSINDSLYVCDQESQQQGEKLSKSFCRPISALKSVETDTVDEDAQPSTSSARCQYAPILKNMRQVNASAQTNEKYLSRAPSCSTSTSILSVGNNLDVNKLCRKELTPHFNRNSASEEVYASFKEIAAEVSVASITKEREDFREDQWADCEENSDSEEICTCHRSSSGSSHGGSNCSLNETEDLEFIASVKDNEFTNFQKVSVIENAITSHSHVVSPNHVVFSNQKQRKRKYNDSRVLADGDCDSGIINSEGDISSRKRIAYDFSGSPRQTQISNALMLSSVIATSSTSSVLATCSPNSRRTPRSIIPTRENPPPELEDWLSQFQRWSHAERLLAVDRLIEHCEPTQVRHMMKVIEPQFQRDFISLLPRELALQVLAYLDPMDLLRAAQTCRSWRFLCDDNLLWKEKCRTSQILTELRNDRPRRGRVGNMPHIASPWKAAYMRQHIIEMNWRSRVIRDPKVLKGHDDHVITCLQFSGNRIVSGSDDNTLKVWSAVTGKCLRTLVGHTGGVWSSQMSGNTIISGSTDRTLKVWDMETGQCVHTLLGHTSTVRCMHLHGKRVVSGSRDATLRVWDIEQGTCLHVLVGHLAAVRCVQYDGKLIVSGAYDYMVKIWHPERQECLHTLQGHTNRVYSLQFDGIHVVSGSLDTSIRVWDVETGNCKHTLMGHQSLTSGMELRQNILVSGNADSTVKVWDITTGQCLQTLSGPNKHQSAVTCLQFNSRFVVTSSDDGTVKLWDVKTGEFIRNLVALDSGGSGGVVWRIRANDTKLICAVGSRNGTEETKLMVLDFDVEGACVKCS